MSHIQRLTTSFNMIVSIMQKEPHTLTSVETNMVYVCMSMATPFTVNDMPMGMSLQMLKDTYLPFFYTLIELFRNFHSPMVAYIKQCNMIPNPSHFIEWLFHQDIIKKDEKSHLEVSYWNDPNMFQQLLYEKLSLYRP